MNLQTYPDRDLMMMAVADKITSELSQTLRGADRASLCVPGGTTPGPIFDILTGVDLEWDRISVFLNDERWVGEDSPRSNTRLLRQRLLQGRAAAATLVPLYADSETPEESLGALAEGLAPHLPISVLLLGMGADMHTASLFPGADRLAEAMAPGAPLLLPMRADGAGEPRITLTAPVLRDAMHIHVLITGKDKRAAIERAAGLPELSAPVRAFLSTATVHWAE